VQALSRFGSAARGQPVYDGGTHIERLFRTIYLIDYFTNSAFRAELQHVLNRGGAVHTVQRAIHIGKVPLELTRHNDSLAAVSSALALLSNAVMAWNTIHMPRAVDQIEATSGETVQAGDFTRRRPRARDSKFAPTVDQDAPRCQYVCHRAFASLLEFRPMSARRAALRRATDSHVIQKQNQPDSNYLISRGILIGPARKTASSQDQPTVAKCIEIKDRPAPAKSTITPGSQRGCCWSNRRSRAGFVRRACSVTWQHRARRPLLGEILRREHEGDQHELVNLRQELSRLHAGIFDAYMATRKVQHR
jgi:hypothetical protein